MESTLKAVTCKNCGWVHMGISRKIAEDEIKSFSEYFDTLSPKQQQDYYGGKKSSIKQYEQCFNCGGSYKNFRIFKEEDCPEGCTIQTIITEL